MPENLRKALPNSLQSSNRLRLILPTESNRQVLLGNLLGLPSLISSGLEQSQKIFWDLLGVGFKTNHVSPVVLCFFMFWELQRTLSLETNMF